MKVCKLLGCIMMLAGLTAEAQQQALTLETCYALARQNYPLIKQYDLIARTSRYTVANAGKLYLPQLTVSGQATYQSEVVNFAEVLPPIPGLNPPQLSKDQYRLQAEVSQQIYDGGVTRYQQEASRANEKVQQQSLEVSLYAVRERVTQLYFAVLLMDAQLRQNALRRDNLQSTTDKMKAALANGVAYRSNVAELQAEIVNADMATTEFRANRKAYLKMLATFIHQPLSDSTVLAYPETTRPAEGIHRPELALYDYQQNTYDVQERQLKAAYLPKLNAFLQGGYGRPTLNIVSNEFGSWWMGGLRLNWSIGSLYSLKNNRRLLDIQRSNVDVSQEAFLLNTTLTMQQQHQDVDKYAALMTQDEEAIRLRAAVLQSAKAQLDNGVITVHEYISQVNAENLAKQTRILHEIQLLQAQYNYKNTSGN